MNKESYAMQRTEPMLSKGDWVFHPRIPAWGYGQVLEILSENKGRVFFLLAGEKKLSWEHAGLDRIGSDTESQAALNDQLSEFKLKLAREILTAEDFSQGVSCTSCGSPGAKCELCKDPSESLKVYSLNQKGKVCLCDMCRDKIMLETKDRAEIDQTVMEMGKGGKKKPAAGANKRAKAKVVKS